MRHLLLLTLLIPIFCFAGKQAEERLEASVQAQMQQSVSDLASQKLIFSQKEEADQWLNNMSSRLSRFVPDPVYRRDFLVTLQYEASRAGLEPEMVLGLIHVESGFRKYAVSSVGARGFMQVMPFWPKTIGTKEQNLFHLRTNIRYGCTILRHYLDIEKGNLVRALARYNGSLGKTQYPNAVISHWKRYWAYQPFISPMKTASTGDNILKN
ncbi:MAG: lytic transglycosylase domain-containing protein [Pseudomonadota bacterium]